MFQAGMEYCLTIKLDHVVSKQDCLLTQNKDEVWVPCVSKWINLCKYLLREKAHTH